jgi:hypothetical protein
LTTVQFTVRSVYAIKHPVKVQKTTTAFFASACGILRRLHFRRRALAQFNNEENK